MHTEDPLVDHCSNRKEVKDICKLLPNNLRSILSLALRKETIDLGRLPCFVVSSQKSETFRVAELKQHQIGYCFDGSVASVHIVA